ncbi:MAG: hypothetical protein KAG14_04300 [Mycoplasmataceae bacterium]|nr:hypothetical protein [Mycoplasmataceae bacterium]
MSNKLKEAYIKYISNTSNFLEITTEEGDVFVCDTKDDKFPHLIGKDHFKKFKQIPASKFINMILTEKIDNKTINNLPEKSKQHVNLKVRAFKSINTLEKSEIIYDEGNKIKISSFILVDAVIIVKGDSSSQVIALKKIQGNIFIPISLLHMNNSQNRMKRLFEEKSYKVITIKKNKKNNFNSK